MASLIGVFSGPEHEPWQINWTGHRRKHLSIVITGSRRFNEAVRGTHEGSVVVAHASRVLPHTTKRLLQIEESAPSVRDRQLPGITYADGVMKWISGFDEPVTHYQVG